MASSKAYIIDYDLISPLGVGKDGMFHSLQNNVCAENIVQRFDTVGLPFRVAAEVSGELTEFQKDLPEAVLESMQFDRKFELTVSAYKLMEERLMSLTENVKEDRKGIVMGVGADVLAFELFEEELMDFLQNGKQPFDELLAKPSLYHTNIKQTWNAYDCHAIYIAEQLGLGAFQKSILTACTSSTQAVAKAVQSIRYGQCDLVIAGGTDSLINSLALMSFGKLGVLPQSQGETFTSCKPFDLNRNGTLAGEAAGLVVVVSDKYKAEHNIQPICEVKGIGNTLDAYKITAPDPSGESMTLAIEQALAETNWKPSEVDYVHAHGTGTRQNDEVELKSLHNVFKEEAGEIPMSSTKDRHGHAIAAAGVQELSVSLLSMENNFVPGGIHLKHPMNSSFIMPQENELKQVDKVLMNNFAFGGINTVLALNKC